MGCPDRHGRRRRGRPARASRGCRSWPRSSRRRGRRRHSRPRVWRPSRECRWSSSRRRGVAVLGPRVDAGCRVRPGDGVRHRELPPARDATALFALPVIGVLWANLHGSALLGLVAILAIGLLSLPSGALGVSPRPRVAPLAVAALASLVAAIVNPYGPALLLYPFDRAVASAFSFDIIEWRSPDFRSPELLVARVLIASLLLLAAAWPRRRRDPFLLLTAAGWTFEHSEPAVPADRRAGRRGRRRPGDRSVSGAMVGDQAGQCGRCRDRPLRRPAPSSRPRRWRRWPSWRWAGRSSFRLPRRCDRPSAAGRGPRRPRGATLLRADPAGVWMGWLRDRNDRSRGRGVWELRRGSARGAGFCRGRDKRSATVARWPRRRDRAHAGQRTAIALAGPRRKAGVLRIATHRRRSTSGAICPTVSSDRVSGARARPGTTD